MNRAFHLLFALALAVVPAATASEAAPRVTIETSAGAIVVELDAAKAPATVTNFLGYVDREYYDGTVFHRVIPGFMVQGGGFDAGLTKKPTAAPVENEAANGLLNARGSIAMARTNAPHSATSQFFINLVDNDQLDHPSFDGWGYAVFGRVIDGMDVVDAIAAVPTGRRGPMGDVPVETVTITSIRRLTEE